MNSGGYARMLWDLKTMPLGEWHPRKIVRTTAYADQIRRSFTPIQLYLFNACYDGVWPTMTVEQSDWTTKPIRFFAEDFRTGFRAWAKDHGINPGNSGRGNNQLLTKEFKDVFPDAKTDLRAVVPDDSTVPATPSDGRAQCFEIPSLVQCRAAFDLATHHANDWPDIGDTNGAADDYNFE
jgi:hypothetical protein